MPRPATTARRALAWVLVPAFALAGLPGGAPAAARANTMESRDGRKECRHVPNCVTVKTDLQRLSAGQPVDREFVCPKGTYFWNWSATVAPFVQVTLADTRADQDRHEIAATFQYYAQTGNGPGQAQVYLACSKTPIAAGTLQQRRVGYGWNPPQRP